MYSSAQELTEEAVETKQWWNTKQKIIHQQNRAEWWIHRGIIFGSNYWQYSFMESSHWFGVQKFSVLRKLAAEFPTYILKTAYHALFYVLSSRDMQDTQQKLLLLKKAVWINHIVDTVT